MVLKLQCIAVFSFFLGGRVFALGFWLNTGLYCDYYYLVVDFFFLLFFGVGIISGIRYSQCLARIKPRSAKR